MQDSGVTAPFVTTEHQDLYSDENKKGPELG